MHKKNIYLGLSTISIKIFKSSTKTSTMSKLLIREFIIIFIII